MYHMNTQDTETLYWLERNQAVDMENHALAQEAKAQEAKRNMNDAYAALQATQRKNEELEAELAKERRWREELSAIAAAQCHILKAVREGNTTLSDEEYHLLFKGLLQSHIKEVAEANNQSFDDNTFKGRLVRATKWIEQEETHHSNYFKS